MVLPLLVLLLVALVPPGLLAGAAGVTGLALDAAAGRVPRRWAAWLAGLGFLAVAPAAVYSLVVCASSVVLP